MSMLKKLKETQKNPVFLDEEDDMDIDNMDFPLPESSSAGTPDMAGLQKMMQGMSSNFQPSEPKKEHISVATGPQGVVRLRPEQYKDWVTVYPCYIDSSKSTQQGRKISKEKSVNEPHAYHMAVAVQRLGLSVVYENKCHPKDWANVGRVRVQLKTPERRYLNTKLTSRKQLFAAIAEIMPSVQKETKVPDTYASPLITLEEVDKQRKAQGLPALSDMNFNPLSPGGAPGPQTPPAKQKKQKIKYVRG
ncbi:signal recognition particle, SRP19 subunit [Sporodiniella umbellata]|nr:signal recognition particle, SRP19 subunit [Sporodiniella umbellata]